MWREEKEGDTSRDGKRLKLGILVVTSENKCNLVCSRDHKHSLSGVVAGNLGLHEVKPLLDFNIVIVANRFPSWIWNLGGGRSWVRGILLEGHGLRWKEMLEEGLGNIPYVGNTEHISFRQWAMWDRARFPAPRSNFQDERALYIYIYV